MAGLKTITIYTSDIIKGTPKMTDKLGRLDLLGQILSAYKIKVHPHSTSPADQNTCLPPFSVIARGEVHNTELTIQLLRNAEILTGKQQVEAANDLLENHDIYLEAE